MCLSRSGRLQHQRLQARVEDERRDGVDELRLEQLHRRDLGEQEAPRVAVAQVDLLQVLVEPAGGEEVSAGGELGRAGVQQLDAAQPLVAAEQRAHLGARLPRRLLALEHVPVELGRPAHGLAGVVDDEVEPVVVRAQVVAERLDARRVPQVEPEDLQPLAPLLEVVLARVPLGRVAGEARGHDQVRAGAQELDPRLVADLDPPAGEECDPAAQVGGLRPLGEVEVGALGAELVVERMDLAVELLADVAVLRLDDLAELRPRRRPAARTRPARTRSAS